MEYDENNHNSMEAAKSIEEKLKPLLTQDAFVQNVSINNFLETVDVSNLTKSDLSLQTIKFTLKEKVANTFIFDYQVDVRFKKYNDEDLTQIETITGEMKVTNTEKDGWQVSSSTQTHFSLEHIKSIQKKFGLPSGGFRWEK
ncbi:hypothetical protein [Virgibacillus phasianinus]|nr:hypothetical protein [Virgibacillus phasianinus]